MIDIDMEKLYEIELEEECKYGKDPEADLLVLLESCRKNIDGFNEGLIRKAFWFCYEAHKGVFRSSGDPYYTHPLKVALSLISEIYFADNVSIVAALLHDTVEDVETITLEKIKSEFSEEIAYIVDGVTKIKGTYTRNMDVAVTYSKLFMALVYDKRVMLIKLADRLDNLRTLQYLKPSKQKVIGEETLNFYTPIAQRLGLTGIKRSLEDLSLFFINRETYEAIRLKLKEKRLDFLQYFENFHNLVNQKLSERNIPHILTIEHKHIYQIYKMIEQGQRLEEIDNFYSMVITLLTNDFAECYRAYGIIANIFGPVSSLDDYIARPKINFYRALHSVHFGPSRKLVELIIRTEDMDKIADGGISALFSIKEGRHALKFEKSEIESWVKWMKDIISDDDIDAMQKVWGSIRMNLYEEEVMVHIVNGDSIRLPVGACLVDVAFALSEDIGMKCISAKVNGDIQTLNYEVKNHDKIEIIWSPNSKPLPEWQDFVVTLRATVGLYEYFRENRLGIKPPTNPLQSIIVKLRIKGDDKPGMLNEITNAIDRNNIQRINMYSHNSIFEGVFSIKLADMEHLSNLLARLLRIKGLRGVERIEEEDEEDN